MLEKTEGAFENGEFEIQATVGTRHRTKIERNEVHVQQLYNIFFVFVMSQPEILKYFKR